MIKILKIISLLFVSSVLSGELGVKTQNKQQYADATFGQTAISEIDNTRKSQIQNENARDSVPIQSHGNNDRPFFTTSESNLEKAPILKRASMSSLSDSSSSDDDSFSVDSDRSDFFSSPKSSSSSSSDSSSFSFSDSCSSSSSLPSFSSSSSCNRKPMKRLPLATTVNKITFQRPWCAGQALASLIPIASEPIYRWLESPETCVEFAKRFGNLYISVSNFYNNGQLLCQYAPDGGNVPESEYAAIRALSINVPIYASVLDAGRDNTPFAVAYGLIFERDGIVLEIGIAKPVSELPQIC